MARRYLQATTLFQPIRSARVLDARILSGVSAQLLEQSLTGQQFHSAQRHGKRLFLGLNQDLWLTLHLGLTGDLVYLQSLKDQPGHTRLLITFKNGRALAFDDPRIFGEVGLIGSPAAFIEEHRLGPDALQIDQAGFLQIMQGRRGMIKPLLLNQSLVAGLGNLYADEALFQAGIHPRARAPDQTRLDSLFSCIREVLKTAIACRADFGCLPESYLLPHRYAGGRCPRDGALLEHEKIGGRTSYYCPQHQRE